MKAKRPCFCILALAVALATVSPVLAAAPDCTGISSVHNTDPDLIGELVAERVAFGLSDPVGLAFAPGDDERMFVVQQGGVIRLVKDGVLSNFMTVPGVLGGSERGLLGLAFDPDYQDNGHFFTYKTASSPTGAVTIERYTRLNADQGDNTSGVIVFQQSHTISNHNGGGLLFGPDDHLYASVGDGGSGCDPGPGIGNAQNLNVNLGKMLRFNVDSLPYTTTGNPFDGATPGNDEIWHYGLRNPWRFSFDRVTGAMYIGDVGQNLREEVHCTESGQSGDNYGWNAYEGNLCDTCDYPDSCPIELDNYVEPILDYAQGGAKSVIGGYVYRGCRMPDLQGTYFYSDHYNDFVNTFRTSASCQVGPTTNRENDLEPGGGVSISAIASYAEDNQGEMYIVDNGGEIYKILPTLGIMEVSGDNGATPFTMDANGDFNWENLQEASDNPVRFYKIYRSDEPDGPFVCVHKQGSASTEWALGGDPDVPGSNEVFHYLVTGENLAGEETTAGVQSGGTLREVDTLSVCD